MKVECLRIGAVRICLALMLGLLLVSGYIVTPVLFAKAGSTEMAGMLAGQLFHVANSGLLLLAASVAFFWFRTTQAGTRIGKLQWSLLLAVALMVAVNEFVLASILADLKQQMGVIDRVPGNDPQRELFGVWHGAASLLHLLSTLCAALLVALGARPAGCKPAFEEA
jgi:hypothetical protein